MEWFDKLEGLSCKEGRKLSRLAASIKTQGNIAEIGSWKGKSTIYLAKGLGRGKRVVYAIDPHTGSEEHKKQYGKVWTFVEFQKNIKRAGVSSIVKPTLMFSVPASRKIKEKVALVFIDGAHDYVSVKKDFEAWIPKVLDNGYVVLHDTILWDGPRRLAAEKIIGSRKFRNVGFVGSMLWAQKVRDNTGLDRLRTRMVFASKNTYEFFYKIYEKIVT